MRERGRSQEGRMFVKSYKLSYFYCYKMLCPLPGNFANLFPSGSLSFYVHMETQFIIQRINEELKDLRNTPGACTVELIELNELLFLASPAACRMDR